MEAVRAVPIGAAHPAAVVATGAASAAAVISAAADQEEVGDPISDLGLRITDRRR